MPRAAGRSAMVLVIVILLIVLFATGAWWGRHRIRGGVVALLDIFSHRQVYAPPVPPITERLVAHAGGAVRGIPYTNSREALDQHYTAGYRVFEVDLQWTSDGRLVLGHGWTSTSEFFAVPPHVFSYAEFINGARNDNLHQMTFEDLQQWLRDHRDAFVVTDTKDSNLRLLSWLLANTSDIRAQLIVQIYRLTELDAARRLSPRAVWLTVYKYDYPAWALSRMSGVDAFVIPAESYHRYSGAVAAAKVPVYVHSVPAQSVDDTFRRLPGIYGIYVD